MAFWNEMVSEMVVTSKWFNLSDIRQFVWAFFPTNCFRLSQFACCTYAILYFTMLNDMFSAVQEL